MPQNIFNLYSASIFADHPIALWNLDDDLSYMSLVSASPIWTMTGGSSASVAIGPKTKPGETVGTADADIVYSTFAGSSSAMVMKSQPFLSKTGIDTNKSSVCVSTFIYPYEDDIDSVEIGFEYTHPITSQVTQSYELYEAPVESDWLKINHTMLLSASVLSASPINIYPYIKVNYNILPKNQKFSLSKFSVGQWSEQYNADTEGSLAVPFTSLSSSAAIASSIGGVYSSSPSLIKTVEIDSYSLSDQDNGYYVIENNRMLATNSKLPMVYGSGNITELYASSYDGPSIIIPGKGFLHSNGQYNQLTAEFWLKVNVTKQESTRIFGPLNSLDGLYVDRNYMTLRIGPYQKSYSVSKWYMPVLIDITYSPNYATLMINGEVVIEININQSDIAFIDDSIFNNDWLGFYAASGIYPFEIDCIAIYPYIVPEQLAKRKFVFGQGVGKSDDIVKKFGGSLTNIDFAYAGYTTNLIYPDMTRWSDGIYSNLEVDSKFISLPQYDAPQVIYVGDDLSVFTPNRTNRSWFGISQKNWEVWSGIPWAQLANTREASVTYDNHVLQNDSDPIKFIRLRPNSSYNSVYGSIAFNGYNVLNDRVSSLYGIFAVNRDDINDAKADSDIEELTIMHFYNRATNKTFKIYINPDTDSLIYKYESTIIYQYELNINDDDILFVAGIKIDTLNEAYAAVLNNFFSNPQNIAFTVGGNDRNMFTGKIYNVTFNNKFFTDKDLSNYFNSNGIFLPTGNPYISWSSAIATYIGNYSLSFKKTNDSMTIDVGSVGYWEDSIPLSFFASFVRNGRGDITSSDLDLLQFNIDFPGSGFISDNLNNNTERNLYSYVTLKAVEDVGSVGYRNYTITKDLGTERVVDFDAVTTNIDITKFEVIDGTVIVTPKELISFEDAYITVHIELKTDATVMNPLTLRGMSIASLSFDERSLYALNTINGNKLYPFSRQGRSYSTKVKNPFIIYKQSMPYLFLTADSGITSIPYSLVDNDNSVSYNRGISISINPSENIEYDLHGFHLWMCYNETTTFSEQFKIFTLISETDTFNFYLVPQDGGKRAKIIAYRKTVSGDVEYTNIKYYQNGILLDSQYIYPMSWSLITFSFTEPISMDGYIGRLEIHPRILFNNVCFYNQSIIKKVDDIFESHLGLSNIVAQDSSTLTITSETPKMYTGITWSLFSGKPV